MIEFPEAVTLSRQMGETLQGARIHDCQRGNSPHKFAFYSYPPEKYAQVMNGAVLGRSRVDGGHALVQVGDEHTLVLGGGGEKIILHPDASPLPKKHQLLLEFEDGRCLTVTVQGWGAVMLYNPDELAAHPYFNPPRVASLSDKFTPEYFQGLFHALDPDDKRSVKYFIISDPQIHGVGNGYLQDILYRARLHPRRRVVQFTPQQQLSLYESIRGTLRQAVEQDGRDTESSLFGSPGRYVPLMDRRTNGSPCSRCGSTIEKDSYLGGSVYFCPRCQPLQN